MQENINRYEEDEIDLRELLKTITKNKKTIFLFTGIVTALAIIYVLVKQPIYEVKSNVMVGYMGLDKDKKRIDIADPAVISKRLNVVFNVEDELEVEEFISEVSRISINKKLKNFITIKTEAISNEEALKKNKEVIEYLQNLYKSRIDRYIVNTNNNIKATEIKIENLENLETKNVQRQIELMKTQSIVKIDEKIKRLKDQNIKNLQREIKLLKTQNIVKVSEKIDFYQNIKIKTLHEKVNFHTEKLKEYTIAVKGIYQNNRNNEDKTTLAISSIQMVNYQNLILNSQNKIEDLKIEIEILKNQTIPNLQREKKNLLNVNIKDLQLKIDNINNVTIVNLQREKKNIENDTLRKLEYKLNVEMPNKKVKFYERIEELKYNKSKQNIQNSKLIGEFVIDDDPLKPKKILIIIVAFITGLILSIFLIFFLESINSAKKEEK